MKNSQKKSFKKHQLKQIVGGTNGGSFRRANKATSNVQSTSDQSLNGISQSVKG